MAVISGPVVGQVAQFNLTSETVRKHSKDEALPTFVMSGSETEPDLRITLVEGLINYVCAVRFRSVRFADL